MKYPKKKKNQKIKKKIKSNQHAAKCTCFIYDTHSVKCISGQANNVIHLMVLKIKWRKSGPKVILTDPYCIHNHLFSYVDRYTHNQFV